MPAEEVCGIDHTPQAYYHTRADNAESLDEGCLSVSLDLCLEIARQYDAQAMTPPLRAAV